MFVCKSVCCYNVTVLFVFIYFGLTYSLESLQFITKLQQKSSQDWEIDDFHEFEDLKYGKFDDTDKSDVGDDFEIVQDVESRDWFEEKEIKQEPKIYTEIIQNKKRAVRQVMNGYSSIYPTLSPQYPYPINPTPYRPTAGSTGNHYGNVPNTYPHQNNVSAYPNHGSIKPTYYPQGQNPFLRNTSYTNPGNFNQSFINNNRSNLQNPMASSLSNLNTMGIYNYTRGPISNNRQYQQYNQNSGQYNSSNQSQHYSHYPSMNKTKPTSPGNLPYYGNHSQSNNGNRYTINTIPTDIRSSNTYNNGIYRNGFISNSSTPNYPYIYKTTNSYNNFNNSTPRPNINHQPSPWNTYPQYNPLQGSPLNQTHQRYPPYNTTNPQYNSNRPNQWSTNGYLTTQTPYNSPGNNFPTYNPINYPSHNNTFNQRPYSLPSSVNNPYSQNYPGGPNINNYNNNRYNKEPDHFFFTPGNKSTSYDPRNNPSHHFSYVH